jgi:hypothetical protein
VAGAMVQGEFFILSDVSTERLNVTEGALLVCKESELKSLEAKLTPGTRFALNIFFEKMRPANFVPFDL